MLARDITTCATFLPSTSSDVPFHCAHTHHTHIPLAGPARTWPDLSVGAPPCRMLRSVRAIRRTLSRREAAMKPAFAAKTATASPISSPCVSMFSVSFVVHPRLPAKTATARSPLRARSGAGGEVSHAPANINRARQKPGHLWPLAAQPPEEKRSCAPQDLATFGYSWPRHRPAHPWPDLRPHILSGPADPDRLLTRHRRPPVELHSRQRLMVSFSHATLDIR